MGAVHDVASQEITLRWNRYQDLPSSLYEEVPETCLQQQIEQLSVQLCAPCFGSDGSISIVQHGIVHRLPKVMSGPRGSQTLSGSLEEHKLALSLRCRLMCEPAYCDADCDQCGASVCKTYQWSAKKFGYTCPVKALLEPPDSRIRHFLCNNKCPDQFCTTTCPWYHPYNGMLDLTTQRAQRVIKFMWGSAIQSLTGRPSHSKCLHCVANTSNVSLAWVLHMMVSLIV